MLSNASLKTKVLYSATAIGFVAAILLGLVIYTTSIQPIQNAEKSRIISEMTEYINGQINAKVQAGILGSSALSTQENISNALEVEEREKIVPILAQIRDQFRNQTNYKNIQTQLITADGRSMVKSWDIKRYGQDLSHNPMIKHVMEHKQAFSALSIGGRGVSVIAISPVMREGEMLGMVSMIQGLASVRKNFTKEKQGQWLLLVDRNYVKNRYGDMPAIDNNTLFSDQYVLANNRWFPEEVVNFSKTAFQPIQGKQEAVYIHDDKVFIDIPAYDEAHHIFGRHLFVLNKSQYQEPIDAALHAAKITLLGVVIAIFLLTLTIVIVITRLVINPLKRVQKTTSKILETGDFSIRNSVNSNDEVGQTSKAINQLLEQIGLVLKDANQTVHAISQGDFSKRIEGSYQGDLEQLKSGINSSTEIISDVMVSLSTAMSAMREGKYNTVINTQNSTGSYKLMLENAQQAFNETNLVVTQINGVMVEMLAGNYSQRVEIEAKGDLNTLKIHINESMEALNSAITDINRVVSALSTGDLTQTITNQYQGDLLLVKEAINQSITNLSGIVSQATQSSGIVQNGAHTLATGAVELSDRIQQQAAAVEETSATIKEMNFAVQNNTESAKQASLVIESVQLETQQASEVMGKTIQAMNSIEDSSNEIAEIVTLIDSIAFQTNLLALNAAVEAARAGEHGRGFAVVAGEVRSLAQKSADAAKDIKQLINSSVERIGQGTKLASESGTVIEEINDSIRKVANMIHQINHSSQEQAEGITQVHHAVSEIDSTTQANASLVEKTSLTAESMSKQASILNENMSFFTTHEGATNYPTVFNK
ncbi:MAG: HAMP domain-containing protein [Gammaproteobacteria bacterium]|nr:HAMP domain-containing protein [Gammaproteobacteria bacterium]